MASVVCSCPVMPASPQAVGRRAVLLTAVQVCQHPWIAKASPDTKLDSTIASLKKYNASRKLKKAALGIMAQAKLAKAMDALNVAGGQ
eukprot:4072521-Pleurochrysis_carterae.AAC.2